MTAKPEGHLPRNTRTGSDPRARTVFSNELAEFLSVKLTDTPERPGIKNEDFVFGLIDAVVRVSREVPAGMGMAVLQVMVMELMERIDAELHGPGPVVSSADTKAGASSGRGAFLPSPIKTGAVDTPEMTAWEDWSTWNDDSPLHRLGYSVAEGSASESGRRAVLTEAFKVDELPGVIADIDKQRWGASSSAKRLYAISNFVAWLARFQGGEKPAACAKWVSDLAWLKQSFYRSAMKFEWPVVERYSPSRKAPSRKRTPTPAFMKALTPSAALAAVVGAAPQPRTEVVSKLWVYIKKNKLQDAVNKRVINADRNLKLIFGKKQVSMFEMAGLIGKHLS